MTSNSKPYASLARPLVFRSLTEDEISLLHEASLEIMVCTGIRFYEQEALDLFKKAGASISDGNLVRVPHHVVEWAMRTAPKNVTIYTRDGLRMMALGGYRSYFGVGSDCMYIYDVHNGERRRAVLEDVRCGARLVDALPNISFVMSMFMPHDVPVETYERHQMAVMLLETRKPIVFVGTDLSSTVDTIEMAAIVAGGLDTLLSKPSVINYVNVTGPLQHNKEGVQRLLYAAERNLPTIYLPGAKRGIDTPITAAGAMAMGNAGQLAGLVLSQLKREGSPFIRGNPAWGELDLSLMTSLYVSPGPIRPAGWDLAHHYGLPIFGTAGCSDAKVFDAQAAGEASLSILSHAISGANLVHDIGYLDCAMTGSLELVAFCDEIIEWVRRYLLKVEISEETLALDLIDEIGPDGSFLESEHTLRHVREEWRPKLIDRRSYQRWFERGATTLQERANQKVLQILETHHPEPFPEDVVAAVQAVVRRADQRLSGR
ncbi:MAG: trimethylamine methyltransferase family protein [Anaerolineales bacterium]|nr:MAG: trimethylamine methyltransferase family protein [Anaerolineales bacterium]